MIVEISNREVLESGSVVLNGRDNIVFKFTTEIVIEISFKKDEKDKEQRIDTKISDGVFHLIFVNYKDNNLGSGLKEPFPVFTMEGKKIYFNFIIHIIGSGETRSICFNYTWLKGEEEHE